MLGQRTIRLRCPVCSNKMEPCPMLGCSFWLCGYCPLGWDQLQSLAHSRHDHQEDE